MQSHGCSDFICVDQLLTSIQTKEGILFESPRRLLIESPTWGTRCALILRLLHAWARGPPWPKRGPPVALAIYAPIAQCSKGLAAYVQRELIDRRAKYRFSSALTARQFRAAWRTLPALGQKLLFILNDSDIALGAAGADGSNGGGGRRRWPTEIRELLAGRLFPEARVIVIGATSPATEPHNPYQLQSHSQSAQHQAAHSHQLHRDLLPLIHRHVSHRGLTWGRSAALLGGGEWGAPQCLLGAVQHSPSLRNIARTPLGCLALAAIYQSAGETREALPSEEIDVVEAVVNCVTAGSTAGSNAALGRLALFYLKAKRSAVTAAEIRLYCNGGGGGSDEHLTTLGCLERISTIGVGPAANSAATSGAIYTPICAGVMEFLAANYLASLAQRPGLLSAEIAGLSPTDEIEPHMLLVLSFAMSLLGTRAHILLSRLTPLWLSPAAVFFLALAGGDSSPNSNTLCDLLGISRTPQVCPLLESNPIWVQCRCNSSELLGWAMALRSRACQLKNLELNYQMDSGNGGGSNRQQQQANGSNQVPILTAVDTFLGALAANRSVATLRISSLIETDARDSDIQLLAQCVARALLKPRLESFELMLTLLEEDPPPLKLQPVVTALCKALPRQPTLRNLHLDLGLCASQIIELCATLEQVDEGAVRHVSLPHLRCERSSVAAIARLLARKQLASLALPFCWGTGTGFGVGGGGARDDPPSSSSGISMGSSSNGGTSCLIKQSSINSGQQVALSPSSKSLYPVHGGASFCSLPRGTMSGTGVGGGGVGGVGGAGVGGHGQSGGVTGAISAASGAGKLMNSGRSATLPRPPLDGQTQYKQRSYDSVVSRMWYATGTNSSTASAVTSATSSGGGGGEGVLHDVLMAARATDSRLAALDLSKAQLTLADAICLGETVRQSVTLHSVRLEGAARWNEILPAMLGAGESRSLQMMVLASTRLSVDDAALVMAARALMYCGTLRLLVLDGWSFRIDNNATMAAIRTALTYTMIREVSLNNCRVYLSTSAHDDCVLDDNLLESTSIVVLKLAGIQIITPDNVFRGPQIISHLCGFTSLRDLDISAPPRSGLAVSISPLIIDDKGILQFFNNLHCHFKKLATLKICNWILHLDDSARTFRALARTLRASSLNHIKADGISVLDRPRKLRCEHLFLDTFLGALRRLRWLEISLAGKRDEQIVAIGESIMRIREDVIDIKISDSSIDNARLLAQTIGANGKFDIGVSTFGTSSGILVHVEKISAAYRRSSSSRPT